MVNLAGREGGRKEEGFVGLLLPLSALPHPLDTASESN